MAKNGEKFPDLPDAARGALIQALAAGLPRPVAANLAGIGERTLYRCLSVARKASRGVAWQFWQDLKKAEATAVQDRLSKVWAAADDSWQAAAWWLERRYPEHFGSDRRELAELRRELRHLAEQLAGMRGGGGQGGVDARGGAAAPPGGDGLGGR